jgi:hypothetical protein
MCYSIILMTCILGSTCISTVTVGQKPPTLSHTIPVFEALCRLWQEQQTEHIDRHNTIEPGLEKLESYTDQTVRVPAYSLAIHK